MPKTNQPSKNKPPKTKPVEKPTENALDKLTPEQRAFVEAKVIEKVADLPPVFFDARDGSYWFKPRNRFLQLSTRSLQRHFRYRGVSDFLITEYSMKATEYPIFKAEQENVVDYAGSLAGYRQGLYEQNGRRYLVTEEPKGVWDDLPTDGIPEFFQAFIVELLGEDDQWVHFCHWLSASFRSLRSGDFKGGQAVILAGPAQSGKSLLQYIVTQVLGGRSANPHAYMFGKTDFNFDLIGAEHWMFEDPPTTLDLRSRLEFGERLKECCNNDEFRAHRKNKDAQLVRVFRRVCGSINSAPEQLAKVPPLVDGTEDKINLYKCAPAIQSLRRFIVTEEQEILPGMDDVAIPIGQQNRKLVRETIIKELPLIRGWLLRCFKDVPAHLSDDRMTIRSYHHPELLKIINELAPEAKLLQMIDNAEPWSAFDAMAVQQWRGKASDLQKFLQQNDPSAERLFRFSNACGTYLGRLETRHADRISSRVSNGYTIWTIKPPVAIDEAKPEEKNGHTETKTDPQN